MSLNRAQKTERCSAAIRQSRVLWSALKGGWTEKEEQQAFDAGFQSVTLGKRVFAAETASLAAIAAMQTLWAILHKVQAV